MRKVIMKYCVDSFCYIIGYSNINKNKVAVPENTHLSFFDQFMYYFTDIFDANMFFDFASCSHRKMSFYSISESLKKL